MTSMARYVGKKEQYGVKPGEEHVVDVSTFIINGECPYIWVQTVDENDDYLMPYASICSMLNDWEFPVCDKDVAARQEIVESQWGLTYSTEYSAGGGRGSIS